MSKVISLSICFAVSVFMTGCASVEMVSKYDETIDSQAQRLQEKLDGYLVSMHSASNEARKYKNQQKFYEAVLSDLNAMEVRAGGIYDNASTIEALDQVKANLAYLVLSHKHCVGQPLSEQQTALVEQNGIDLSMDCKVSHGADQAIADRGERTLEPAQAAQAQTAFNQHLGTVMALELAKKRGEEPSAQGESTAQERTLLAMGIF